MSWIRNPEQRRLFRLFRTLTQPHQTSSDSRPSGTGWKKATSVAAATALLFGTAAALPVTTAMADVPTVLAEGTASVPNFSFEDSAPGQPPANWLLRYTGPDTSATIIADASIDGNNALQILDSSTTSQVGMQSDPVTLSGNTAYEIGAWGNVSQGIPTFIVIFFDDNGQEVTRSSLRIPSANSQWTWYSVSVTTAPEVRSARVLLYSSPNDVTNAIWDYVEVIETTDEERFPNNGFEDLVVGDLPVRWSARYIQPADSFTVVDSPVREGDKALRMHDPSSTAQIGLLSSASPITAGQAYEVGVWALTEQGIPSWVMYYYDASGAQISQVTHRIYTATGDWNWESEITVAPDNAASVRFLLYSSTQDVTDVVWDDIQIEAITIWPEESMGYPISAGNILDTSYGIGSDGRPKIYAVTAAVPATFQVIDAQTGTLEHAEQLDTGSTGAWAVLTASDGTVYIGVYNNGYLYRWLPEEEQLINLGKPTSRALYLWDLEEDEDGLIWGGTYPKAELFSFDPVTEQFTDYGQIADEEYVRSVAVHEDKVFAGLGSNNPRIIVLDKNTDEFSTIELPAEHRDNEFVYFFDNRGDLLFARLTPSNHLLVYDLNTGTWIDDLGQTGFGPVSQPDANNTIYFVSASSELLTYNLDTRERGTTGISGLQAPRDFGWATYTDQGFTDQTLTFMYTTGEIIRYNPLSGALDNNLSEAIEAPIKLQALNMGPDGRLYVTGYMYEGMAAIDTATGETEIYPRNTFGQIEGLVPHLGELYTGSYTRSHLHRFDVGGEWAQGQNPNWLGTMQDIGQDRPFAWTSHGEVVVTGTVPTYGKAGGALAVYDPHTDTLEVHDDPLPGHSIVSLTSDGNLIYGGTSIFGGLGAIASDTEGKVFAWDPDTNTVVWSVSVGTGIQAVSGVEIAPDGSLWAIDVGKLYELDPATGAVLRSVQVVPYLWLGSAVWVSSDIKFNQDGDMYVLARGTLFKVDTDTLKPRQLAANVSSYTMAVDGNDIYYFRSDELFRVRGPQAIFELELSGFATQQAITNQAQEFRLGYAQSSHLAPNSGDVSIDWGHGSEPVIFSVTNNWADLRATHTFSQPGSYTAVLTVSDGVSTQSVEIPIQVSDEAIPVDKSNLLEALDHARGLYQSDYTPQSWGVLMAAVEYGQQVFDDELATVEHVDSAQQSVLSAIANLLMVDADTGDEDGAGDGSDGGNVPGDNPNEVPAPGSGSGLPTTGSATLPLVLTIVALLLAGLIAIAATRHNRKIHQTLID